MKLVLTVKKNNWIGLFTRRTIFMKTKVLLTGNQETIIDDFFMHTEESFICMTTSVRHADMKLHLQTFKPEVFVYCLGGNTIADSENICIAKRCCRDDNILFVAIGAEEDISVMNPLAEKYLDLKLIKPITIKKIQEEIEKTLERREALLQEILEDKKRREEEAKKAEKKTILVVDDDPVMLRTVKHYLEEKYVVATAPSGKFAIKFLSQRTADLVLLDYEMPEVDGPEVFKTIKDSEDSKDVPVVFLTGITDTEKIKTVLAMQPQGYLLKPVDYERLHQTIEGILF